VKKNSGRPIKKKRGEITEKDHLSPHQLRCPHIRERGGLYMQTHGRGRICGSRTIAEIEG